MFQPEGLPVVSKTFPRSGSMRNGECWQQPTLEPVTGGERLFILATADTNPGQPATIVQHRRMQPCDPTFGLCGKTMADAARHEDGTDKTGKIGAGANSKQVEQWATPMAADDGHKVTAASKIGLIPQVTKWATPGATDGDKGGPNCRSRGRPNSCGTNGIVADACREVSRRELEGNT